MPKPTNITELRAFIGFVNYYGRFIQNLSEILHPLHRLLKKNTKFDWDQKCDNAFKLAIKAFSRDDFLMHYNPKLPITLATDASAYGVGAVLSHILPDGSEKAIQYASQTLTDTQKKYSQIDKEAYAIIFGIKKFHQYLYARKFILITDHRPLTQIFSPTKNLPIYSAMRMQHYAIFLQGFNYEIKYRRTEMHANADCLSRLPIPQTRKEEYDVIDTFHFETINTLPVTSNEISQNTEKDEELSNLLSVLQKGNADNYNKEHHKFFNVSINEFTLLEGKILGGQRVVLPSPLRPRISKELHSGHFGIIKMKNLARSYCWWPGIDKDLEILDKNCKICNMNLTNPIESKKHSCEPPDKPFERVRVDFAGPFMGHIFFVYIDSFSKWPEIRIVKNINVNTTIKECKKIFSVFGIPEILVSNNGTTFTSTEFQKFLTQNGITHKTSAISPIYEWAS